MVYFKHYYNLQAMQRIVLNMKKKLKIIKDIYTKNDKRAIYSVKNLKSFWHQSLWIQTCQLFVFTSNSDFHMIMTERERTAPGDISCESPPSNHPTNSRTCSFVKEQPLADVSLSQILFGQIEMIFFLCIVAGSGVFKLKEYPGWITPLPSQLPLLPPMFYIVWDERTNILFNRGMGIKWNAF